MKIKIYAGPSLSKTDALKILPTADYAEPIKRGDVYEAIDQGYNYVLIVDGLCKEVFAVSPGELMDVLRYGVRLYGASSIGAIRAAELESFGMVGVGRIFNEVRNTRYFRDYFLGTSQSGKGPSGQPLPYMDISIGCKILVEKKKISKAQMKFILRSYESLHFSERTSKALCELLQYKNENSLVTIVAKIPELMRSVRRADSRLLLSEVKRETQRIQNWNRIQSLRE